MTERGFGRDKTFEVSVVEYKFRKERVGHETNIETLSRDVRKGGVSFVMKYRN